ncbi:hemolysin family protein [Frankia sp. Cj5]|uniref:hemolysin family protein n=1 Tax=Frankia sp. Cj5 TaxID=2880978 RepID=UPI001EF59EC2|nr:hemolysin family protein [Frankia sp. Cj5]
MTQWLLILLSVVLVGACGVFVAAEFALVTVDRSAVARAAEAGDKRSAGVLSALASLSTQLSGAQVGITITNLAVGFLAEPAIARILDGPLESVGVPAGAARGVSVTAALALATTITMIYGELVPKNLAVARPLPTARALQGFQRGFSRVAGYPIRLLNGTANGLLRRLGFEPQEELASARSAQELFALVGRSAEKGTLAPETATLLQRSLAFGHKQAADVLTPRVRMCTVQVDDPVREVIAMARRTGHSRFPVVGQGLDDVVGLVHVKHAVSVGEDDRERVTVGEIMIDHLVVPSTIELDPLLETLRRGGLQLAVVIDEFGGTDGLVTIEDLIEELVGDVVDEHDRIAARAQRRKDGTWLLSGLLRVDEAAQTVGIRLPLDDAYQTLGGLIADRLGRLPVAGDVVDVDGVSLAVHLMDGRRVDRVHLVLPRTPRDRRSPDVMGAVR